LILGAVVLRPWRLLPLPEIRYGDFFTVVLRRLGEKVGESSLKTSEKTSEKILAAIRQNRGITILELATLLNVTERSIERNIQKLQIEKRLRRVGPDKGGHWEVGE
jgi:ATP-dependent DNA helicase RecG